MYSIDVHLHHFLYIMNISKLLHATQIISYIGGENTYAFVILVDLVGYTKIPFFSPFKKKTFIMCLGLSMSGTCTYHNELLADKYKILP